VPVEILANSTTRGQRLSQRAVVLLIAYRSNNTNLVNQRTELFDEFADNALAIARYAAKRNFLTNHCLFWGNG